MESIPLDVFLLAFPMMPMGSVAAAGVPFAICTP
jgi:hypothetical protein